MPFMRMITGNMITIITTGKMHSPNGIIILTGKALARSSARRIRCKLPTRF